MIGLVESDKLSPMTLNVNSRIRHGQLEYLNAFIKMHGYEEVTLNMIGFNADDEPVWEIIKCL